MTCNSTGPLFGYTCRCWFQVCAFSIKSLACKNIRFSSLFVVEDVSHRGTSATQRQRFHNDDANQCLHDKSGSHEVPNINLSNFACLLVDFGKVLCWSAHELQQNPIASSREDYIPQILTVSLEILRVYIWDDVLQEWFCQQSFFFQKIPVTPQASFLRHLRWWCDQMDNDINQYFRSIHLADSRPWSLSR